jgi:hypothetical protein
VSEQLVQVLLRDETLAQANSSLGPVHAQAVREVAAGPHANVHTERDQIGDIVLVVVVSFVVLELGDKPARVVVALDDLSAAVDAVQHAVAGVPNLRADRKL